MAHFPEPWADVLTFYGILAAIFAFAGLCLWITWWAVSTVVMWIVGNEPWQIAVLLIALAAIVFAFRYQFHVQERDS